MKEKQVVYLGQFIPPAYRIDEHKNLIAVYTVISESIKDIVRDDGWKIKKITPMGPLINYSTDKVIQDSFQIKIVMEREMDLG